MPTQLSSPAFQASQAASVAEESFSGQQEGERILYVVRSHWVRECMFIVKVLLALAGVVLLRHFTAHLLPLSEETLVRGYIVLALAAVLLIFYFVLYCQNTRTYITDRRVLRFQGAFPAFQNKRALFWGDVTKVETHTPNILFQFMKVGHLTIIPNFSPQAQDVRVPFAYYYSDLGAYLEKIVYTFRTKPDQVSEIRPFVPMPKGQRY